MGDLTQFSLETGGPSGSTNALDSDRRSRGTSKHRIPAAQAEMETSTIWRTKESEDSFTLSDHLLILIDNHPDTGDRKQLICES